MKLHNKVMDNNGPQSWLTSGCGAKPQQNSGLQRFFGPKTVAGAFGRIHKTATTAVLGALILPLLIVSAHAQQRPAGFLPDDFAGMSETDHPAYSASGTVRYASPGGSGTACSSGNRCSLQTALNQATSGTTVVVGAGDYHLTSTLGVKPGVTIQAEGASKPRLKGSTVVAASKWTKVAGVNQWFTDSTPPGASYEFPPNDNDPKPELSKNLLAYNREQVFSSTGGGNSQPLVQVATTGAVGAGKFAVDYANDRIYVGDDPATRTLEITSLGTGLTMNVGSRARGLTVMHCAEAGIYTQNGDVTIEDCTVVWNSKAGVNVNGQSGINVPPVSGTKVVNNMVACNGKVGIGGQTLAGVTIRGNTIIRNNAEEARGAWGAAGAKFSGDKVDGAGGGPLIVGNTIADNYAAGLWFDNSCDNSKVFGNIFRNNQGVGVMTEITTGTTIAYNVLDGNAIRVQTAANVDIYNNTFVNIDGATGNLNNSGAVLLREWPRTNDSDHEIGGVPVGGQWVVSGIKLRNNLYVSSGDIALNTDPSPGTNQTRLASQMVSTTDYNGYYGGGTLVAWRRAGGGAAGVDNYSDLPSLRNGTGQELNGYALASNPLGSGYQSIDRVTAGIGTPIGVDAGALTPDGEVPTSEPHLGAYNVQSSPPTVNITAPTSSQEFVGAPATVEVAATASAFNPLGEISKVEFFADGDTTTPINTDTSAPYAYSWTGVSAGDHTIRAKAFDGQGQASALDAVTFTVVGNRAPTVSITSPTNNKSFIGTDSIAMAATATDPDGAADINRVEFFVDGATTPFSTDRDAPYTANWTNVTRGNHTLKAKAFDQAGVASNLATVAIVVKTRVVAVNAGGPAAGAFLPDRWYSGGTTYERNTTVTTSNVSDPAPAEVYQTERYRNGDFTYTMRGLTAGQSYTVRLHFAEVLPSIAVGDRLFNVTVNGPTVLSNFDIRAAAGGLNRAVIREFDTTANAAGEIVVGFTKLSSENPKICGIEVVR